ncbi:flagellar basal-body rod protein FlgF [Humitalea rosea]|uniref:Flagellar basal-body rod protein FlgF n=1 Tax=Humitalea rosea TaxID=990373 RepID=A0A2W7IN07_9PROT|nr:flagellar basal-body rod protein FlgF [Humitalea rosea]PZW46724.1 flagellar basal-body rod protein FlgF [Humitalea rosea]
MDSPGYIILSRLMAQTRATAVLANNMANADTPGFQAQRPIYASYASRSQEQGSADARSSDYIWDRATYRDTAAGPVQQTGNPLDIAISGEGLFVVETPRGERYTRAGHFTLDATGRVVTQAGEPVLNGTGQPLTVAPGDGRLSVAGDGTLSSENGPIGRFRVVRFEDPQRLQAEGNRLFAAADPPIDVDRPALLQGVVEGSNVSPIMEMTRLTEELREFQMASQFADKEGERLQGAIDRILKRR